MYDEFAGKKCISVISPLKNIWILLFIPGNGLLQDQCKTKNKYFCETLKCPLL